MGLGLNSHAAMCARLFGIPRHIVKRAQYVRYALVLTIHVPSTSLTVLTSHLLSIHELGTLLDEEMTEDEKLDLEDAEERCRQFLAWDMEASRGGEVDVKAKLGEVLGRDAEIPEGRLVPSN